MDKLRNEEKIKNDASYQEYLAKNRRDWKIQKYIIICLFIVGIIAICVNGYLRLEVLKMQF